MSPFIGFTIAYEKHSGLVRLHIIEHNRLQKRIVNVVVPESRGRAVKILDQCLPGAGFRACDWIPSGGNEQATALLVEDVLKGVPSAKNSNSSLQFRYAVQPFEHCNVRIGTKIVLINMRIRKPRDHFVVAGVGKCILVSHPRDTFFLLIAKNLPLMCERLP